LELLNDILDLAKVESGTMEVTRTSFDVDELVGEVQKDNSGDSIHNY